MDKNVTSLDRQFEVKIIRTNWGVASVLAIIIIIDIFLLHDVYQFLNKFLRVNTFECFKISLELSVNLNLKV